MGSHIKKTLLKLHLFKTVPLVTSHFNWCQQIARQCGSQWTEKGSSPISAFTICEQFGNRFPNIENNTKTFKKLLMNKPQGVYPTLGDLPLLSDNSRSPNPQRIDLLCEDTYILLLLIKTSLVYMKEELLGGKK